MLRALPLALAAALLTSPALAATLRANLALATPEGPGAAVGTATITGSGKGAKIRLDLHGLPAGQHGLHLHQNASCAATVGPDGKPVPAGGAGPHWDPANAGQHMGPEGQGHLGDLPLVDVGQNGSVKTTLIAPRIKDIATLRGKALMIHAGGDTYADTPPLGGGGARLACGVLE